MSSDHAPQDPAPDAADSPLEGLAPHLQPPPQLEDQVVARLHEQGLLEGASTPRTVGVLLAVAASILASFLLGLGLRGGDDSAQANYMLLLDRTAGVELSAAELDARIAEYNAWARELEDAGVLVAAERLTPGAEHFGPASPAAAPSGFFLIRAGSEEEARTAANACPHLRHGGTVTLQAIDVR